MTEKEKEAEAKAKAKKEAKSESLSDKLSHYEEELSKLAKVKNFRVAAEDGRGKDLVNTSFAINDKDYHFVAQGLMGRLKSTLQRKIRTIKEHLKTTAAVNKL